MSSNPGPEMAIFMFALLIGALIATKTKQSALVGQILIGIVIGPSVLGLVTYNEFVKQISELGIIILLFIVGLECKFKEVYTIKNILIAFFGASITWSFGFLTGFIFGFSTLQSIFIGIAITSTSTAVVAGILRQTGKLRSELGKTIMGASAIDDIIGLLIFSLALRISEGGMTPSLILFKIFIALAFLVIFFMIGVKTSRYLTRMEYWGLRNGYPKIGFIFTLLLAFLFSGVAELAGLSAIMGSFVAGLALEHIENKSFRMGAEYFEIIFGSIFFISLGILVDNLFGMMNNLGLIIVLILAAFFGKVFGCAIGCRLSSVPRKESKIIGVGLSPIGEIAAMAAMVALQRGIFDSNIYSSIIIVGITTSIISPGLITWLLGVRIKSDRVFRFDIKHKRPDFM
ncbi:cation:proton antiporter [Candidatus Woesearchaeota archaeon]|nr:cation:proton antiporter [Candidatus Woesearchaeota archaeon]